MNYVFPVNVTKDLIESKVSQETLMNTYYGVPVKKGLFKSKVRNDNKPTVAYYKNNKGRLIIKDFGSDYCGDWVYVVMHKYNCSYYKALNIVASDLGLIPPQNHIPVKIKYSDVKLENTTDAIIQVEIKEFSPFELNWWASYGIDQSILKKYKVFSCKNVFLNNNLFHLYKERQLVFGYYGGINKDIECWKIYFPNNKKYRFISNWKSNKLQGLHMLPKTDDYLVITKSLKDVMVLYSLGIPSVAPISENCFLSEIQYNCFIKRFKHIILLYDNDRPGLRAMVSIKKKFPEVIPIWIPWKYKAKDISDFYAKYKYDKTIRLVEEAKEYINNQYGRK